MDDWALVEEMDAGLRNAEGGGNIPRHLHALDRMTLGALANPDPVPWYKSKTYWIVIAVILATAGLAFYFAQQKKSDVYLDTDEFLDWE